jgi:hypothetical protein
MINQAIVRKQRVVRYAVSVSSAPYIESSDYLPQSLILKALPSSSSIVGIRKAKENSYFFFCNSNNSVLTEDAKSSLEVSINFLTCCVCQESIWANVGVFTHISKELNSDRIKMSISDDIAYICCSDACKDMLEANPLPYIG